MCGKTRCVAQNKCKWLEISIRNIRYVSTYRTYMLAHAQTNYICIIANVQCMWSSFMGVLVNIKRLGGHLKSIFELSFLLASKGIPICKRVNAQILNVAEKFHMLPLHKFKCYSTCFVVIFPSHSIGSKINHILSLVTSLSISWKYTIPVSTCPLVTVSTSWSSLVWGNVTSQSALLLSSWSGDADGALPSSGIQWGCTKVAWWQVL